MTKANWLPLSCAMLLLYAQVSLHQFELHPLLMSSLIAFDYISAIPETERKRINRIM